MSSTGVCGHCGCTDIDTDPSRGDAVCTNCGSVLEDQIIVSEVQFEEHASGASSVIGQFVSSDGTKSHSLGLSFPHGMKRESRTVTFDNGRRRIQQLGNQLKLNQHCIDTAFNFFKMAVNKRLTQGRKTTHVVAACLYLVCRTEGTPHMLLDFSDQLQVNVYSLGKTYLQLSRALCINIPAIDPCLYIPRFAHKLEFEEKTHEVSMTALRLVSRMKRDWMHTGRRPSGLCGAALLVAARMHDFSRNVKDVIKIAKVCDTTIRKRLNEFKNTPSSQLTIEEFQNIDLEEEQDPPSYTMGKLKAQKAKLTQMEEAQKMPELESEVMELQKEIENELKPAKPRGIWAAYAKMGDAADEKSQSRSSSPSKEITRVSQFLEEETLKPCFEDGEDQKEEVRSDTQTPTPNVTKADTPEDSTVQAPAHSLNMADVVKNCITKDGSNQSGTKEQSGELDLTGIDDAELDRFLLSEDEIKIKTDLWMAENADYLQALKEKEERLAKEKEEEAKNPEKKKKRARKKRQPIQAATAEEAIVKLLQEKKISNKINYDVLNDLKCKKDIKMVAPVQVKSEPLRGSGPVINTKPILSRFRKSSKSVDSKDTEEPMAKKVKFEEVSVKPEVVVESGPVQYAQDIKEEVEVDEEEEEYDEEDELPSAAQLLGHNINREYEEHDLYDDD